MFTRFKISASLMVVLALVVGCGRADATETAALPTITPTSVDTSTPLSPTTPSRITPTPAAYTACAGSIPESTKDQVRQYVDQGFNVGIVVGIVTPCGREVYAYGKTALSGGQAVDENTVFEIGSIGKTFTALLLADMVLDLVERPARQYRWNDRHDGQIRRPQDLVRRIGQARRAVDDDPVIRTTLEEFLVELGYRVSTAENGRRAIDILEQLQESVHLLITDIAMPVMDGIALIRHIRQRFDALPIAVMSGYADDAQIAAAGIHDTVRFNKPMDFAEIGRFLDHL